MTESSARTFSSDFKRFFLRGLVILLPTVLTLWIVVYAYRFVDDVIAEPINRGLRAGLVEVAPHWEPLRSAAEPTEAEIDAALVTAAAKITPVEAVAGMRPPDRPTMRAMLRAEHINRWWAEHWYMNFIGLVVAIVGVYIAGRLLGGFLGRSVYRRLERLITSLPIFKQVYPYVKQIVDFLFGGEQKVKFSGVVMIQYPRPGIWSIGFHTGGAVAEMDQRSGECVTVFIPSSPTPFTGYTVSLPRSEVVELAMTVEEAVRFCVSCGVLIPERADPEGKGADPCPPLPTDLAPSERLRLATSGASAPGPPRTTHHQRGDT